MAQHKEKQDLERVVLDLEVQIHSLKAEKRDNEGQRMQMEITLDNETEIGLDLVEKLEEESGVLRQTMEEIEKHSEVMLQIKKRKSYMTSAIEAMSKSVEQKQNEFSQQRDLEERQMQATSHDFEKKRDFFATMMNWDDTKKSAIIDKSKALEGDAAPSVGDLDKLMTEQYESLNADLKM